MAPSKSPVRVDPSSATLSGCSGDNAIVWIWPYSVCFASPRFASDDAVWLSSATGRRWAGWDEAGSSGISVQTTLRQRPVRPMLHSHYPACAHRPFNRQLDTGNGGSTNKQTEGKKDRQRNEQKVIEGLRRNPTRAETVTDRGRRPGRNSGWRIVRAADSDVRVLEWEQLEQVE